MTQLKISSFFKQSQKHKEVEVIDLDKEEPKKTPKNIDNFIVRDDDSKKQANHEKFVKKLKNQSLRQKRKVLEKGNEPAVQKKSRKSKLTPLETMIVELKSQHLDKILAINVGYKYKFYGPDAQIVSSILNIMMIPGKQSLDDSNPNDLFYDKLAYCSIPDTRLHIHLKRLINKGLKVGVVEQTENAAIKQLSSNKNSLFERKLTNVFTSATYIEDEIEDSMFSKKGGDCIVAIIEKNEETSLMAVNPISGEIVYDNFTDDSRKNLLETRLYHLQPSEYIFLEGAFTKETLDKINFFKNLNGKIRVNTLTNCDTNLEEYFANNLELIEFLKISLNPNLLKCCELLIEFLKEFKLDRILQIKNNYQNFQQSSSMLLNSNTLESLEIFENYTNHSTKGSLLEIVDHTKTIFGFRQLKKWIGAPLIDREMIEQRLQSIDDIKESIKNGDLFIESLSNILKGLPDLEKYLNRLYYGKSNRKEIYLFLKNIEKIMTLINNSNIENLKIKSGLLIDIINDLKKISQENLKFIKKNISVINISAAMNDKDKNNQIIKFFNLDYENYNEIEKIEKKIKEIELLLQNELIPIKKIFRKSSMEYRTILKEEYLVEVSKKNLSLVPDDWVKVNDTKSVIRYRTPKIQELLKQLNFQRAKLIDMNNDLYFNDFLKKLQDHYLTLNSLIKNIGIIDCLFSLTAISINYGYVKPSFVDQQIINVQEGRNPIIERLIENYIPNDISMRKDQSRSLILTGPNMGGKSCYVKQIALIVLLAQIGSYIPAKSAILGVFDAIFTRMGFNDDLMNGKSTFMVEMLECGKIIENCTSNSLVIMDEVGRGTGTTDGISLAYSILNYLISGPNQPLTLFITHFTELCEIELEFPKIIKNVHMNYSEEKNSDDEIGKVTFLYELVDGISKNSYGLNVAKLSHISDDIIKSAFKISKDSEIIQKKKRLINWGVNLRNLLIENENIKEKVESLLNQEKYLN